MKKVYGYVRVSSKDQNEARQMTAMREFGVEESNIVVEKQSGKDFQRPLYRALIERMNPGDVLVVKSIDRLGRNYNEVLDQWSELTKVRHISIVVLDMSMLDTRDENDLTRMLISDIVLQVLSYVAEKERENIRQRQAEGIAAAKARGTQFGRRRIKMPKGFVKLAQKWKNNEITAQEAADQLGLSRQTFSRRANEYLREKE